jgi:hypothetical protein
MGNKGSGGTRGGNMGGTCKGMVEWTVVVGEAGEDSQAHAPARSDVWVSRVAVGVRRKE